MNTQTRKRELRIGYMAIAALLMLVALTYMFGKKSFSPLSGEYRVRARFDSAPGVQASAPVLKNGIVIGRVQDVHLVDDDTMAEVTLLIQAGKKLYSDEECRIKAKILTGDAQIEFVKIKTDEPVTELEPGALIYGATPFDIMNVVTKAEAGVLQAIGNVSDASKKLTGLMESLNVAVGTPEELLNKQQRFLRLLDITEETMRSVNEVVGNPATQDGFRRAAAELPQTLTQLRTILTNTDALVKEMRVTIERSGITMDKVDLNLDNVTQFTNSLGVRGPEIADSLTISANKLQVFISELTNLVEAFNDSEGSIRQLMSDPQVFNDIAQTVDNVRAITDQLRPLMNETKPIVRNVNVLTDKLARQPQLLGLGGVFDRSPPMKGLPKIGYIPSPSYTEQVRRFANDTIVVPSPQMKSQPQQGQPVPCNCQTCVQSRQQQAVRHTTTPQLSFEPVEVSSPISSITAVAMRPEYRVAPSSSDVIPTTPLSTLNTPHSQSQFPSRDGTIPTLSFEPEILPPPEMTLPLSLPLQLPSDPSAAAVPVTRQVEPPRQAMYTMPTYHR